MDHRGFYIVTKVEFETVILMSFAIMPTTTHTQIADLRWLYFICTARGQSVHPQCVCGKCMRVMCVANSTLRIRGARGGFTGGPMSDVPRTKHPADTKVHPHRCDAHVRKMQEIFDATDCHSLAVNDWILYRSISPTHEKFIRNRFDIKKTRRADPIGVGVVAPYSRGIPRNPAPPPSPQRRTHVAMARSTTDVWQIVFGILRTRMITFACSSGRFLSGMKWFSAIFNLHGGLSLTDTVVGL